MVNSVRGLFTLAAISTAAVPVAAQEYRMKVVATNLERPSGIAVTLTGRVFFTELPTPGVGGGSGGRNKVSRLNPWSGAIQVVSTGEPEPTNLATTFCGDAYWTCKSAGVINKFESGTRANVTRGLTKPSGMAAYPFGNALYFTEVPTPGVNGANGGMNAVYAFLEGAGIEVLLDDGDPQPSDVAVDLAGNVYWTCTSAGVIVKLSGGTVTVLARNLNKPYGLATDYLGNLYFTEVPTPGVSGANGGSNRVSKLKLATGRVTVIDEGDPDPIDVAAHPDGTVYWTCRSAGVIVEATPRRR